MLTIRVFNHRDIDGVASVILPIQQDEFGIPITLQAQPDLSDIPNFYQRDHGNFWVAEVDGHVIASVTYRTSTNGTMETSGSLR